MAFFSCKAQSNRYRLIGGPCEGCEAIFEYGERKIASVDTLPDFMDEGPRMKISGTVYNNDGKTPAVGVILYVYHTDQTGVYPTKGDEQGWARRHGYIRGWIITDTDGRYSFYTLKPASYPSRTASAHIHITVLEPDGKYYWLGSFLFAGDPLLSRRENLQESPRGGTSEILKLTKEGNLLVGKRDIILGRNIPGYEQ